MFVEENFLPSLLLSYFCYSRSPPEKAKSKHLTSESVSNEDPESFRVTENVNINLPKAKSKDFYWLIRNYQKYNEIQYIRNTMISMQVQSDGTKLLQKTKQTGERYLDR